MGCAALRDAKIVDSWKKNAPQDRPTCIGDLHCLGGKAAVVQYIAFKAPTSFLRSGPIMHYSACR
jgi:hypothetical protein